MFTKIFVLISLFSFSFLMYFPLSKKEIDLNTDDICYYSEDSNKEYVKACNKGYYCNKKKNNITFGICLEYNPGLKKYNEECSKNSECYIGLVCSNGKCVANKNSKPYNYTDDSSTKRYYYCSDNTFPTKINNDIICDHKTEEDKCFLESKNTSFSSDYLKTCGLYSPDFNSVSTSEFGKVEDGNFVGDSLACKSGFALYFYKDKETHNKASNDPMYQLCVTVNGVEKLKSNDKCAIRYSIGSEEYIYNPEDMDMDAKLYEENHFPFCDAIMTKIDLIQEYFTKFNKLKTHCQKGNFYNEPFTCENDELREIWYYYNNIENYLLYKNDKEVLDYLIEDAYPTPKSKDRKEEKEENKKDMSGFLDNKYFLLLLLLAAI